MQVSIGKMRTYEAGAAGDEYTQVLVSLGIPGFNPSTPGEKF